MDKIEMLQELIKKAERLAVLEAQIESFHRLVDGEETRSMRRGYLRSIDIEVIRDSFGWKMCDDARTARIEYEAEKAVEKAKSGEAE